MTEDRGLDNTVAMIGNSEADSGGGVVLLAQADTGLSALLPSSEITRSIPETSILRPDSQNRVTLRDTVSIENIQLDGDDLILVQPDGSQVRIIGGALDVPTFIIGEIEVPQDVLVAALQADGFNVAAGPDGSLSVALQANSSGGNFDGTLISRFTLADEDTAGALAFRVLNASNQVDSRFEVVAGEAGIYELRLKSGVILDFEAENADSDPTIGLTVEVNDGATGNTITAVQLTVSVTDVNDAPTTDAGSGSGNEPPYPVDSGPLSVGAISLWTAEGNADDQIGKNGLNTGTLKNGTTFSDGVHGQAFSFDGYDDFVYVDPEIPDGGNNFSVTFWMKTTQLGGHPSIWWGGKGLVYADYPSSGNDFGIALLSGHVGFGAGTSATIVSTSWVSTGEWVQVGAVRGSGTLSLYVNGVLEGTTAAPVSTLPSANHITFGGAISGIADVETQGPNGGNWYEGLLDDIAFYSHALTASEMRQISTLATSPVGDLAVLAAGDEDTTLAVTLVGTVPGGTAASFKITAASAHGTLYSDAGLTQVLGIDSIVAASGNEATVYFKPAADWNGTTGIQYAAIDGRGLQDPTPATASLHIAPVNDAPAFAPALAGTVYTGAFTELSSSLIYSDVDDDASSLSFTVSSLLNGKVQVDGVDQNMFSGAELAEHRVWFRHDGSDTTTASFNVKVEDGDEDNSTPVLSPVSLTVDSTNIAPSLSGLADSLAIRQGSPRILDNDVSLTDPDNNFDAGTLTVSGLLAPESIGISSDGAGPGQILYSAGDVSYQGVLIGTASGGGAEDLVVTFNANANAASIEALIERLTYATSAEVSSHPLTVTVTDAAGAAIAAGVNVSFQVEDGGSGGGRGGGGSRFISDAVADNDHSNSAHNDLDGTAVNHELLPVTPLSDPADVTYSFLTATDAGLSAYNAAQQAAAIKTLALWAETAGLTIAAAADGQTGTIVFGNTTNVDYAVFDANADGRGGTIWTNPDFGVTTQVAPGDYGFLTLLHEIGHALGLDHSTGVVTQLGTVMAYDAPDSIGVDWWNADGHWVNPQTPMIDDIATLQWAYGADATTRAGDTVYGFNATADNAVFDFTANANPVLAIYDAGGRDTLDLSGYDSPSVIDLTPGSTSSVNGMTHNVGIAFGTIIETAMGGGGNDIILGNDADNMLSGMGGDDLLIGGLGADTLTGGDGADVFVFGSPALADAEMGILDLIADYNFDEGDVVDLSALLGSEPVTAVNAADYVHMNGRFLEVDVDGAAGSAGFVQISEFTDGPAAHALRILVDDDASHTAVII